MDYEANLPTFKKTPCQNSRLSRPDAHERWAQRFAPPESQRASTPRARGEKMITKSNRFGASRHVKRALNKGLNWRGSYFNLKSFRRRDEGGARLAVVVSRKTLAQAVKRNLLRRRVQGAFREHLPKLNGYDIVVLPNRSALPAKFTELSAEVTRWVEKLSSR